MSLVYVDRESVISRGRTAGAFRRWLDARRCLRNDEALANFYVNRFAGTMRTLGLMNDTFSAAGVPGTRAPEVTSVMLGPAPRMFFQPLPGQVLADFEEVASRLAKALGMARVRLTEHKSLIRMDLVKVDPLLTTVELPAPVRSVRQPITLGLAESGELVRVALADIAHLIFQGATRSGKSRMTYGLLAQLAGCRDLMLVGSDITGILLRPFAETRHADGIVLGGTDLERHVTAFEDLVELMHQRHTRIPKHLDVLPITDQDPLILGVIEEYGVLVDVLGAHDTQHKTKLQARFRAAVRSILAGGAKVGFRILLITQRADATGPAGIGSFERGQASVRLTFRVDTHEAVKLLHPAAPKAVAEDHAFSPAGIALLSGPELPLARLRSPSIGDYGVYADAVAAACGPPMPEAA